MLQVAGLNLQKSELGNDNLQFLQIRKGEPFNAYSSKIY